MKVKTLYESICEEEVLTTLIFKEGDNTGIVHQMIKIVENSRILKNVLHDYSHGRTSVARGIWYLGFDASLGLWLEDPLNLHLSILFF